MKRAPTKGGITYWRCMCSCGRRRTVRAYDLKLGRTQSCGCFNREVTSQARTKHGENRSNKLQSKEYRAWRAMRSRCGNPRDTKFKYYGGRGITVCKRWVKFENFLEDVGRAPSSRHTLERKNNDRGYSKRNCTWATRHAQHRNTRSNVWVTYRGRRMILADWSRKLGIHYLTLRQRLQRWGVARAFTTPVRR